MEQFEINSLFGELTSVDTAVTILCADV